MMDDKKNIERRIKMIKMTDFFGSRRRIILMIGVICIAILSGILLTSGLTRSAAAIDQNKNSVQPKDKLINSVTLKLLTFPEKYALSMSSTPGILILAQYSGVADKVEYSTTYGKLLTWGANGKISEYGQKVELPLDTPVYWSPLVDASVKEPNEIAVKARILNNSAILAENQVNIAFDSSTYLYMVKPQSQNPKTIDGAVSFAIIAQDKGYGSGEVSTEGHIILATEEKDGKIKVYTISSFGAFGFENGIFTKVSGSGAIPTLMTFTKNEKGEYSLLEYKEPMDGAYNLKSKKAMFPQRLWDEVLSEQKYYTDLAKQQEEIFTYK